MTFTLWDLGSSLIVCGSLSVLAGLAGLIRHLSRCTICRDQGTLYAVRKPLGQARWQWYCKSCCRAIDAAARARADAKALRIATAQASLAEKKQQLPRRAVSVRRHPPPFF